MQKDAIFQKMMISFLILLFLFSQNIFASDDFSFRGDELSSVRAKGKEYTLLNGNAEIISDSVFIKADKIEISGKENEFADCTGNVEIQNREKGIFLKANKLFFNRKEDIIRVEGSAVMEDLKNEVIVKGDFLEYRGKEEICFIQIGVRILKDDMVCRSEFAKYSRNSEKLELSGMPSVFWKEDKYEALRIIIDLEKDEIFLEGKVSGTIFSEKGSSQGSGQDENSAKEKETLKK